MSPLPTTTSHADSTFMSNNPHANPSFYKRMLSRLNTLLHHRYIEPLSWLVFWSGYVLISPIFFLFVVAVFLWDIYKGRVFSQSTVPANNRAILVTGCDSGFGHDISLALAKLGWHVYAGCLTDKGLQTLAEHASNHSILITPIRMDVTKPQQIADAARLVDGQHPEGLYGLVNNAGLGVGGLFDWETVDHYRHVMEINYFGVINTTKACLPLLKKIPGSRIVNVTSLAGLMPGQPLMGAYCASKHATDAWTQSLRIELQGWDMHVSRVNPGFHATAIIDGAADRFQDMYDHLDQAKKDEYGEDFIVQLSSNSAFATMTPWDPVNVREALLHATTSKSPKDQYVVGSDAKTIMMLVRMLPSRVLDVVERVALGKKVLVPAAAKLRNNKDVQVSLSQARSPAAHPAAAVEPASAAGLVVVDSMLLPPAFIPPSVNAIKLIAVQ